MRPGGGGAQLILRFRLVRQLPVVACLQLQSLVGLRVEQPGLDGVGHVELNQLDVFAVVVLGDRLKLDRVQDDALVALDDLDEADAVSLVVPAGFC